MADFLRMSKSHGQAALTSNVLAGQERSPAGAVPSPNGTTAERPFFFLHIRKTAGVSLRGLLANRFPADRILFQAHSVGGPQEPSDALFATGHVGFDYAARFKVAPTTFTVLREPMARCVSAYHFLQSHNEAYFQMLARELSEADYQGRQRFWERAIALGPTRFLAEEEALARQYLANVQTRDLAGASGTGLADDDPRLLDAALVHLAQIDLTGIVERFPETLRLLGAMMHWQRLGPLQHLNRTPAPESEIDPAALELLRSWNQLDLSLYAEACRLFEQKRQALPSEADASEFATSLNDDGFTPDQPLHGYGWHEREYFEGRWLCWNSAPIATLSLRAARARPSQFKCLLSHVFNEPALDRFGITLNAQPLDLRKREAAGGILIESEIPAKAWTADPHRAFLTFQCPIMGSPADFNPASPDTRQLGFSLALLRLD